MAQLWKSRGGGAIINNFNTFCPLSLQSFEWRLRISDKNVILLTNVLVKTADSLLLLILFVYSLGVSGFFVFPFLSHLSTSISSLVFSSFIFILFSPFLGISRTPGVFVFYLDTRIVGSILRN